MRELLAVDREHRGVLVVAEREDTAPVRSDQRAAQLQLVVDLRVRRHHHTERQRPTGLAVQVGEHDDGAERGRRLPIAASTPARHLERGPREDLGDEAGGARPVLDCDDALRRPTATERHEDASPFRQVAAHHSNTSAFVEAFEPLGTAVERQHHGNGMHATLRLEDFCDLLGGCGQRATHGLPLRRPSTERRSASIVAHAVSSIALSASAAFSWASAASRVSSSRRSTWPAVRSAKAITSAGVR